MVIFSTVAPHRSQPAAKCHPRWQPTKRLTVSCRLGRRRILTRDCRQQSGMLPLSYHAFLQATRPSYEQPRLPKEPPRLPLSHHAFLEWGYCTYKEKEWLNGGSAHDFDTADVGFESSTSHHRQNAVNRQTLSIPRRITTSDGTVPWAGLWDTVEEEKVPKTL